MGDAILGAVRFRDLSHRPWPRPRAPWALAMRWHELCFLHWRADAARLRALLPPGLRLDTFDGEAWIGVVPFRMSGVRPRLTPPLPRVSAFLELNVRTYVVADGKPGVWFFSLDAASRVAVRAARASFHLPYFDARMAQVLAGDVVRYRSARTHRGAAGAELTARYRPTGPPREAAAGSLEAWLTERYCLYAADPRGVVRRGDIHHARWPLAPAECELERDTMTAWLGVERAPGPPLAHYAHELEVAAWLPGRLRT